MTSAESGSRPVAAARSAPVVSIDRAAAARATMAALAAAPNVFETFFDQTRVGLALADLSTRYVRVNAAYADLVGKAPEDLVGEPFADQLPPEDRSGEDDRISLLLSGREKSLRTEMRYVTPAGQISWVLHGVTVVPDRDGQPAWLAVSAQDITERRRAEQDLRDLTAVLAERAVRDPLTGLANRALFEERLRAVLARDARTGQSTAVLFLDLDGFKLVNDEHGHSMGDLVLRTVSERLRAGVRPSDTVARLGGDEFVVLVEAAGDQGLVALSERLRTAVTRPMRVGSLTLTVGVSVGLAVADGGSADAASLLASADKSMYEEKRAGRRRR